MYNEIGINTGQIEIDLQDLGQLLQELEEFKKSKLFQLFTIDLDIHDRKLMREVKMVLPETVYQEKAREQMIGQSVMAEEMSTWFERAAERLEEYRNQKEAQQ